MQNHGLEVQGGFIVGFDSDPSSVFQELIDFIQDAGVVTAMVGILGAPRGTKLYSRLKAENRILSEWSGDNVSSAAPHFVPKMDPGTLVNGYKHIMNTIYSPEYYYKRLGTFLMRYKPQTNPQVGRSSQSALGTFRTTVAHIRNLLVIGFKDEGRYHFWGLFISLLLKRRHLLPVMMSLSFSGYHFRQFTKRSCQ